MSKRVSLPAADDLFRPTSRETAAEPAPAPPPAAASRAAAPAEPVAAKPAAKKAAKREPGKSSGRVRHDEKMTVYITSDELLDIEHARLTLRRTHGLAVDRGRLVRQAVAMALAELDEHGDESQLVRRLREP